MTLFPPGSGRRRPTEQEALSLQLVSGLLIIIGIAAYALLFYSIAANGLLREATQGPAIPGIGVDIQRVVPPAGAEDQTPYFELTPLPGGPAQAAGVQAGDRLIRIDGEDLSPDMTAEQIEERLLERDVSLDVDDFAIGIDLLRPRPNGSLAEVSRQVLKNVPPTPLVAFLKSFGIIVPVLVLVLGAGFVYLGLRLRQYKLWAARWALVAFLWLMVGMIVVAVVVFWTQGQGGLITNAPFDTGRGLGAALPILLLVVPMFIAYRWLSSMTDVLFAGEESLTDRSTRFAWTLLVPTVTILILVAARPLEQSFIKSLTDDQFGTSRPARFVGLRNYQDLLSFQFAVVPCQTAETGDCERTRTGEVRWERSALEVEQEQRLREGTADRSRPRYEAVFTIPLPGTNGLRLLATDPKFFESFTNTLVFSVISVTLELLIGLAIALVVNSRFRGRGLMRTAMLVPWAIPTVVSATLWQVIMRPDQTGILNRLLMDLGFISRAEPVQWLSSSGPWMASIIAVDVWKTAPFMALLLLAGLQTIPADIYEAAEVDGASKLRQFFSVTLPLLRPALAVALIFRTLDALRVFDVFQVLLDVRRPSMATYNYNILVNNQADGYASTVGVVIFVIIFIFSVMYVRVVGIGQRG